MKEPNYFITFTKKDGEIVQIRPLMTLAAFSEYLRRYNLKHKRKRFKEDYDFIKMPTK